MDGGALIGMWGCIIGGGGDGLRSMMGSGDGGSVDMRRMRGNGCVSVSNGWMKGAGGGCSHCNLKRSHRLSGGRHPSAFSGHTFFMGAGGLMKGDRRRLGGVGREDFRGIGSDCSGRRCNDVASCGARDDL